MAYSTVERPEASYRVIYGSHDTVTPASELPSQYDALFLEGGYHFTHGELFESFEFSESDQYFEVTQDAKEKEVRLYFGDILFKEFPVQTKYLSDWQDAILFAEGGAGALLFGSLFTELAFRKEISRRDFLRLGAQGIGMLWCLSYLSGLGTYLFEENQRVTEFQEKVTSWDNQIHPEFLSLWFRNAVLARKIMAIGRSESARQRRRAEVPVVLGSLHTGLAEFLRKGEEFCEKVVQTYPQWYLEAMIKDLEHLSLVTEASFDDWVNGWIVAGRFMIEGLYLSVNQEKESSSRRKEAI